MLSAMLKNVTSDQLLYALKTNQEVVQLTLHKLEAYRSFGEALNNEQQVYVSSNLDKLNDFFKSKDGKAAIAVLAEEFVTFCKQ